MSVRLGSWWHWSSLALVALALLAAPMQSSAQPAAPVSVCAGGGPISPGQGLGPITIGMPLADATTLLGPPQRMGRDVQYGSVWSFASYTEGPNTNLTLLARDGKISIISLRLSPNLAGCATSDQSVRLGLAADKIQKVLGKPQGTFQETPLSMWWSYDVNLGLLIMVGALDQSSNHAIVRGVDIFGRGTGCEQLNAMHLLKWTALSCAYFAPQSFPEGTPRP